MLEKLLDKLFQSRERLLVALEYLPDEALQEAGAVGAWSVADLLNVLTAWESELVTAMMRLERGQKPEKLLAAIAEPDAFNERVVKQGQARDLDPVFDDFQKVRMRLEEWLEFFSEKQLSNPKQFKWFKGQSLAQMIEQYAYSHEKGYVPALEAFAAGWQDETAAPDDRIILLPMIDVRKDENDESN
jgi:hypothetical protein